MRTTIRIDDQLLSEVKQWAAKTGRTLTEFIEDTLRAALAKRGDSEKRRPIRLPTFTGKGLQPGVDLNSSAALLDLMERSDEAR